MPFSAKTIRRLLRLLIGLACCATLIAVAWQIENIRGERAWKAAIKTYADRGDPLDVFPAPPPGIPSDKNFWQTPLLSSLAVARVNSHEMKAFKAAHPFFAIIPSSQETWETGKPLNLDSIATRIVETRKKKNLPKLPSAPTSASFVLTQFPATDPVIAELHTAALARPDSRFIRSNIPPLGRLLEIDLPSYGFLRQLTISLQIQASAALAVHDTDTAFSATLANLQLANGLDDHPYTLVEGMIAVVIQRLAIQPLWEGIHQHAWTDEQLAHLTIILSRSHLFESLASSLRIERNNLMFLTLSALNKPADTTWHPHLYSYMPEGWWRQNQISYARLHNPILLAIDSHSTPAFLDRLRASKLTPPSAFSPYKFFGWAFLPAYEKVTANTARSANATRLALTACALERHRLAHGAYPESLTPLVPAFLPAVPLDVINGDPLHYHLNPDGTFTLYSVGLDGDDDHGRRAPTNSANPLDADGDWAW